MVDLGEPDDVEEPEKVEAMVGAGKPDAEPDAEPNVDELANFEDLDPRSR